MFYPKQHVCLQDGKRKIDPHIANPQLGLINFKLNIFSGEQLYLLPISVLWDFNTLCNKKPASIGIFKTVETQLLALNIMIINGLSLIVRLMVKSAEKIGVCP